MRKKLDWTLSVIVLVAYATLWVVYWIMAYNPVPDWVLKAIEITRTVALCLMYCVVLYNALCWTDSWVLRIIFIALALFLMSSAIAGYVPAVEKFFTSNGIPLMR